jgi:hypothetical protein
MGRRKGSKNGKKPGTVELLIALGYSDKQEKDKEYKNDECAICLQPIECSEQLTLPCGHKFHGNCCKEWANYNHANDEMDMSIPMTNRKICYFRLNHNIFNCPTCRCEYSRDPRDDFKIKKVHGKVHSKLRGERYVHYITEPMDLVAYVPFSEIRPDNSVSEKWTIYITTLLKIWKMSENNDVYPVKRLYPAPEFLLKTEYLMWPPVNKDGTFDEDSCRDGNHLFKLVDVEDLNAVLNDV